MKRISLLVLCAVFLFGITAWLTAGCGDSNGPASVAEEFVYAQADKDCDKLVSLLDSSSKDTLSKAQGPQGDPAEGCRQTMEAQTQAIEITDFKVIEENINGDTATVKFSISGNVDGQSMSEEDTANMVKENGEWKVSLFAASSQPSGQSTQPSGQTAQPGSQSGGQ
jgi:hypothetical protein